MLRVESHSSLRRKAHKLRTLVSSTHRHRFNHSHLNHSFHSREAIIKVKTKMIDTTTHSFNHCGVGVGVAASAAAVMAGSNGGTGNGGTANSR